MSCGILGVPAIPKDLDSGEKERKAAAARGFRFPSLFIAGIRTGGRQYANGLVLNGLNLRNEWPSLSVPGWSPLSSESQERSPLFLRLRSPMPQLTVAPCVPGGQSFEGPFVLTRNAAPARG